MEEIEPLDFISFKRVIYTDFWGTRIENLGGKGQVLKVNKGKTKGFRTATVGSGSMKLKAILDDATLIGKQTQLSVDNNEILPEGTMISYKEPSNQYDWDKK